MQLIYECIITINKFTEHDNTSINPQIIKYINY